MCTPGPAVLWSGTSPAAAGSYSKTEQFTFTFNGQSYTCAVLGSTTISYDQSTDVTTLLYMTRLESSDETCRSQVFGVSASLSYRRAETRSRWRRSPRRREWRLGVGPTSRGRSWT
jgi:hypothetical protein